MLAVNISDTSLEYFRIKKNIRGKYAISHAGRLVVVAPSIGESLIEKLPKEYEIVLSLSNAHVFMHRLELDPSVPQQARNHALFERASALIPYSESELILAHNPLYINPQNNKLVTLFCAAPKKNIIDLTSSFTKRKYTVTSILPESLSAHEVIRDFISNQEVVLQVDLRAKRTACVFFDVYGPYLVLSYEKTQNLSPLIKSSINFFKAKYLFSVSKIILSGGESLNVDLQRLAKEVAIPVISIAPLIAQKLTTYSLKLQVSEQELVYYLNTLGASFASLRHSPINLFIAPAQQRLQEPPIKNQSISTQKNNSNIMKAMLILVGIVVFAAIILGFLYVLHGRLI